MKKFLFAWLPVLLWAFIIFSFSAQPTIQTSIIVFWDFVIKKTAHVTEYAILAILLIRALYISMPRLSQKVLYLVTAFASITYAASDEFHQRFTPGRNSTLRDVIIDGIGISVALFIIFKIRENQQLFLPVLKLLSLDKSE